MSGRGACAGGAPNGFQLENGSAKALAEGGGPKRRPNSESNRLCAEAEAAVSASAASAMLVAIPLSRQLLCG
jgi:hypothetical protein